MQQLLKKNFLRKRKFGQEQEKKTNTAAKDKKPLRRHFQNYSVTVSMLWPHGRLLFHCTLSQTHGEDGNGYGQNQDDN